MVRKIDTIKRLRFFGDILMLGTFLMLIMVFLSAYLNDDFSTRVNINNYGEAHIEMVLLVFFLLPLFLITAALSFLDWRQTWKAKERILEQRYLLTDAPNLSNALLEARLVCPGCGVRFSVDNPYYNAVVECPACGLFGRYTPGPEERESLKDNGPTVRVIKDIRR